MLTDKAIAGLKAYIDRTIVYATIKLTGRTTKRRLAAANT